MSLHRLRYKLIIWSTRSPRLYFALRRMTGRMNARCVGPQTDIVIEGFPRSANSATAHAFIDRQEQGSRVAHHLHHVAQLLEGIRLGIPCVVLIRDPKSAILSLRALRVEAQNREKAGRNGETFEDALKAWLTFYDTLRPQLSHVVIAPFEEVTQSVAPLISDVNRRFGTQFATTLPAGRSERVLGYHAKPTPLRDDIKRKLAAELELLIKTNTGFRRDLARATQLYQTYLDAYAQRPDSFGARS
ncbi:hypothetical protein [Aliiroseovarius crassostreae]|uniref:hypothetical protein n=1 Tax=Aliiroseovarius crassostreae TaxID=154981 RepID=UPI002201C7AC|nr:hypothetical protein [Aliiroseovarius crassostreae]UWP88870.1 hypothetical protein K3J57_13560 [Aliiroseovarius crassostreae]